MLFISANTFSHAGTIKFWPLRECTIPP